METLEKELQTTLSLCWPCSDPDDNITCQETGYPTHGSTTVMNYGNTVYTNSLELNFIEEFDAKNHLMIKEENRSNSVSGRTTQLRNKMQSESLDLSLSLSVGSPVLNFELMLSSGVSPATTPSSTGTRAKVVLCSPDVENDPHGDDGIDLDPMLLCPTITTSQPLKRAKRESSPRLVADHHMMSSMSRKKVEFKIERNNDVIIGDVRDDHDMIDPWVVKKVITKSDVGGQARLLIGKGLVRQHILPHLVHYLHMIHELDEGLRVVVLDCDTNTSHRLKFKWWKSSKSYVLIEGWTTHFVTRRGLKPGDQIGLSCSACGTDNVSFFFSVLNRVAEP